MCSFIYEEFVSKTSYIHPDMLLICIIDFLLQLKQFKSHKTCSYCGLLSVDVLHNVYKVIKRGMSDMQEWTEEVLEPNKTLFLCFSLCMFKFYDSVRKQFFQL